MKKIRHVGFAVLLSGVVSGQVFVNGSFEFDNDSGDGSHNYWGNGTTALIADGSTSSFLPGWSISRSDTWQYDWDGAGPALPETNQVNVFNSNSDLWPGNPYGGLRGQSVVNGPNLGNHPFDAIDGSLYLGFYNDHSPASLTTSTTASTTLTGLTAGAFYRVSYFYAGVGETNAGEYDIRLQVNVDGNEQVTEQVLAYIDEPVNPGPSTGVWKDDNGAYNAGVYTNWTQGSFDFQASGTESVLDFVGLLQGGPAMLVLDGVTVAAVPEAGSTMLVFLGLVSGLAFRRRRI